MKRRSFIKSLFAGAAALCPLFRAPKSKPPEPDAPFIRDWSGGPIVEHTLRTNVPMNFTPRVYVYDGDTVTEFDLPEIEIV